LDPSPPSVLDLDAAGVNHTAGDGTTWGKVADERRGEADEDPPHWLTGLEEKEPQKQGVLWYEGAPLACWSSGAMKPMLSCFAVRGFKDP
jgi:hypothetical protein